MPWPDSAHRRLMQLLSEAGQRSEAQAQYARCREVLAAEYGVEPGYETEDLVQRIRGGLSRPNGTGLQPIRVVIIEAHDLYRELLVRTLKLYENKRRLSPPIR